MPIAWIILLKNFGGSASLTSFRLLSYEFMLIIWTLIEWIFIEHLTYARHYYEFCESISLKSHIFYINMVMFVYLQFFLISYARMLFSFLHVVSHMEQ